jgi:hypothetical protein
MNELIEKEKSAMNETKTWSKRIQVGNMTKEVAVEQIENGFVVSLITEGEEKDGGWKYECKKYISTKNPFEGLKKEEEPDMSFIEKIDLSLIM